MADDDFGRRGFITTVGTVAGAAAVGYAAADSSAKPSAVAPDGADAPVASGRDDAPPAIGPSIAELLGPVQPGWTAGGWTVEATYGVFHGAAPIVLRRGDDRLQVDVLRYDALTDPRPLAASVHHGLYVTRRDRATSSDIGVAVRAIADVIASREGGVPAAGLVSFDARRTLHADAVYSVIQPELRA